MMMIFFRFRFLLENATQSFLSEKSFEAVLAVPVNWSAESRRNVIRAASEAGFNVRQVITEPTAALLAYEIGFNETSSGAVEPTIANAADEYVLVYRMGGHTTDATLFRIHQSGLYEQLATSHLPYGGNLITKRLADYMMPAAVKRLADDLSAAQLRDVRIKVNCHAEHCKRVLSTMQSVRVYMENLLVHDDRVIESNLTVTRARFENSFSGDLPAFMSIIDQVLEAATLPQGRSVDRVILCGGDMRIPKLQSAISAQFCDDENSKTIILSSIPTDEVVSIGCARQASFLVGGASSPIDSDGDLVNDIDMEMPTISENIFLQTDDSSTEQLLFVAHTPLPTELRPVLNGSTHIRQGAAKIDAITGSDDAAAASTTNDGTKLVLMAQITLQKMADSTSGKLPTLELQYEQLIS